ncbi:MAG: HlyC/CorC family transporter [Desulfobacteraceae bacterium]|nr:HlyC/CorC family transporter [Desulfobacteraceae bacterium]
MENINPWHLLFLYSAAVVVTSFVCSIAEAVLLSVRTPYVASLEQKGKPSGKALRKLKENVNRPLSAILTLNTIANTIGAAGVGAQAGKIFSDWYVGLTSAVLTMVILIVSEIIPKTLGAIYWRQLAPYVARLLNFLLLVLAPFVWLAQFLTSGISQPNKLTGFSREEFAAMADLGAMEGQLEAKESRIMKNLFRFQSSQSKDIMTPRTVVFALQENMTIAEFFDRHHHTPFSRIPIYNENRDDITGFVLKDEILLAQARDLNDSKLHEFRREIKAIASSDSLSELFEFLLDRREHIVLVMDEYGGMEGIVTLEDVIETLLGLEIVDEADKTVDMQALARALWEKRAKRMGLLSDNVKEDSENVMLAEKADQDTASENTNAADADQDTASAATSENADQQA